MKEQFLREIIYQIKSRPSLKKKIKIFLIVGLAGFVLTTGLLVWGAFSFLGYMGSQIQTSHLNGQVQEIQTNLKQLPTVNAIGCWARAQSLMNYETWFLRPIEDNFKALKQSCLNINPQPCQGSDCDPVGQPETKNWSS